MEACKVSGTATMSTDARVASARQPTAAGDYYMTTNHRQKHGMSCDQRAVVGVGRRI